MSRLLVIAVLTVGCQNTESREEVQPAIARAVHEIAAPWTLTASDGSGLAMTRVDAKAVVEGPLAFTELHLYFHNAEPRTREGTFAITLPPGAAVSRFAMELDGRLQEAEVIDKAFARQVYDDFLHRRQDPALLEKAAGNQFSARVFPIPGHADKHLVIAYSQVLEGAAYVLPLRGLPKIERVDLHLTTKGHRDEALAERNWQPDRDFVSTVPAESAAVGAGELVVATVEAGARKPAADAPRQLAVLVDTSASRALGFASYVASVHAMIGELRARYGEIALSVVAFDQDSERIFDGPAADYGAAQDAALLARGAAGASDLGQALAAIGGARRVVVVTDGMMTAGPESAELVAAARELPIERLDVVLAGGMRDDVLAAALAAAGPHAGDVYDLDRGAAEVAAGLGEAVNANVPIAVAGARWVYPASLPAVRPGRSVVVYARLAKPAAQVEIAIGGDKRMLAVTAAPSALIERAVAEAEIDELEAQLGVAKDGVALRADIARRSVAARVISSQTAMLVLESEADYDRYHIDRRALADILVVGADGVAQTHRKTIVAGGAAPADESVIVRPLGDRKVRLGGPRSPVFGGAEVDRPATTDEPERARQQALDSPRSSGSLASDSGFASLQGTGDFSSGFDDRNIYGGLLRESQYGPNPSGGARVQAGHGALRARVAAIPSVTIGQPVVSGDLDRPVIRRYIKRSTERITYCYEKVLLRKPRLRGTMTVQFFISPDGKVASATAAGFDDEVGTCVANAVKDIAFPAHRGGGGIEVNYPFTFVPAGSARVADAPVARPADPAWNAGPPPLTGKLAEVMSALAAGHADRALAIAKPWHDGEPGDVLALVGYGEALEASNERARAARIYGSIIDLYPARADLRRFAGERLERLGNARKLAIDTYRRAVADRPDHLSGHRLLAHALLRDGDHAGALAAILAGIDQPYPAGRFPGGDRVLAEDAAMIGAVYVAHGGSRAAVTAQLAHHSIVLAERPSTRFILYWETDANDVDFHIVDRAGKHAFYQQRALASGGELYADVTTGYGPECFAIPGVPAGGPYHLSINYYAQGPMGYGMGLVQIEKFDGKDLSFDDRPYVVMTSRAFVDLGTSQ